MKRATMRRGLAALAAMAVAGCASCLGDELPEGEPGVGVNQEDEARDYIRDESNR